MAHPFGSFGPLFGESSPYLKFLHLRNFDADLLRSAIAASGASLTAAIRPMLDYENWRPQLVGAAAMVMARHTDSLPDLWRAIDRPSWISPQLVAAAALLDPEFEAKARLRIERRCKLDLPQAEPDWTPERHSAFGPSSWHGHSAKLMVSFVAIYRQMFPENTWLDLLVQLDDVRELLASDFDGSGDMWSGTKRRRKSSFRPRRSSWIPS